MTSAPTVKATVSQETGPKSGTKWDVTSSPPFSLLGKENRSPSAIKCYRSPATNLRGLVVTTDEPLCSLHILLATESNGGGAGPGKFGGDASGGGPGGAWHHPDDGLPHTLEHLVFLGSRTHPHKGILDKLANRCCADGTNAWTATDHTAYTLRTAGGEGALNLLPVFADHVLFPTLTDSGFVTEIHHVNGRGENKGVVYCEMQGRENSEGSLVDRAVMEIVYPPAADGALTCGYAAETGGKMANLRALTADKVRRYHAEYYTSDNCILILTGNVRSEDFFAALDEVEALVLKRQPTAEAGARDGRRAGRPWIDSAIPPMVADGRIGVFPPYGAAAAAPAPMSVAFPSDDESRGTISIAWRGPPYAARATWAHLALLWDYLSDSPTSPLQLAFVENEAPLCADVGPASDVSMQGYYQLWFQEVDVEAMEACVPLFFDVIAAQAGVTGAENGEAFDVARMRTVIQRARRKLLSSAENSPTGAVVDGIMRNFLYGPRAGEEQEGSVVSRQDEMEALHADVDMLPFLDAAEARFADDAEHWRGLIKRYILDQPMAVCYGKPSAAMSQEISDEEKARETGQAAELGEEGLGRLAKTLEDAMTENEQPIPIDILTSLPVPDLEKVPSIPLFTARLSPSADSLALDVVPDSVRDVSAEDTAAIVSGLKRDAKLTAAPFYADLTHIDSAFLFAAVGVDTTPLTKEQRLYLPILDEILFKLPATLENGEKWSKDEFINQIESETTSYSCGMTGLLGRGVPQMSYICAQVEAGDDGTGLATALQWIRRAMFLTHITVESVKTAVQRLVSEIPPTIRSAPAVNSAVSAEFNYDSTTSNALACSVFRQKPFLSKIYEGIEKGDDSGVTDVVAELERIRAALYQTSNMHAFVAGNLRRIPALVDTLVASLARAEGDKAPGRLIENVSASSALRCQLKESSGGEGACVALSATESGFLTIVAPGVKAYDEHRASLLLAIEYLTALEGDFWVKLRGAGLTYSYSISDSTDSQLLRFGLFKCTDIPAAFEKASDIITEYASGKAEVSAIGLENAKASLAYSIISGRSSKFSAATSSFVRIFKGEKMDYDKHMLSRISKVTAEDVVHALITHLVPIFDPSSNLSITCPTNKLDQVHAYFTKRGWTNLKKIPEEELFSAFVGKDDTKKPVVLPDKVAGMSMFLPGAFAAQFRCACPRCDR